MGICVSRYNQFGSSGHGRIDRDRTGEFIFLGYRRRVSIVKSTLNTYVHARFRTLQQQVHTRTSPNRKSNGRVCMNNNNNSFSTLRWAGGQTKNK